MAARLSIDLEGATLADLESLVQQAIALGTERNAAITTRVVSHGRTARVTISVPVTIRKVILEQGK
jgi:hypothetical protein